jgi:hypothetical protein
MPTSNFEKIKNNLPSKKFVIVIVVCASLVTIALIAGSYFGSHSIFSKKNANLVEANGTIKDLLTQDSNINGIPDWEESLWGVDPKGDGPTNKKIVEEKKAQANITPIDPNTPSNQTDKFSQALLSTILALNQSGELNTASLAKLSESISEDIDLKRANPTQYSLSDMALVPSTTKSRASYKKSLEDILDLYADLELGSELGLIYQGASPGGQDALNKLIPYAEAYAEISQKMLKLKTPDDIGEIALDIVNTSHVMSVAIPKIITLYTDALSGMVGINDYVDASDKADKAVNNMNLSFGL